MHEKIFEKYKKINSDLLNEQIILSMTVPVTEIIKMMFIFSIVFFFLIGAYESYNLNFSFEYIKNISLSLLFAILVYSSFLIFSNQVMSRFLIPKIYFSMKIRDRLFEKGIEKYFDLKDAATRIVMASMQGKIDDQERAIGGYNGSLLIEIQENILKTRYQLSNNVTQIA